MNVLKSISWVNIIYFGQCENVSPLWENGNLIECYIAIRNKLVFGVNLWLIESQTNIYRKNIFLDLQMIQNEFYNVVSVDVQDAGICAFLSSIEIIKLVVFKSN